MTLDYARRLDQLEQAGDENTLAAVVIARALLERNAHLEHELAWHTGESSGWAEPRPVPAGSPLNDFDETEVGRG